MNMQIGIIGVLVLIALAGGALFLSGGNNAMMQKTDDVMMKEEDAMKNDTMMKDDTTTKDDGMMEKDAMMMHGGTYEAYSPEKIAWAQNGKVVLFFRASWCPTCKAMDADIRAHLTAIPKDVTILDVNYDTEVVLKKKYGVTYQHTFVQVDASGNKIVMWSGSPTLSEMLAKVQ